MQPFHPKSLLLPIIAGIIGLLLYFNLRTEVSPKASIDIRISSSEAEKKAKSELEKLGYSLEGLSSETSFNLNSPVQNFLAEKVGASEMRNIILADTIVSHRWRVYFYDAQTSTGRMAHQYIVWLTQTGTLCGYNHTLQDTASGDILSVDSAAVIAKQFLETLSIDLSKFYLQKTTSISQPKRTDHTFIWAETDSVFDARTEITVRIQGKEVGSYSREFRPPQDFTQRVSDSFSSFTVVIIISYVLIFFLVITVISVFLKKYHEGEVGVGTALSIAGFLFLIVALSTIIDYESVGSGVQMGDMNRTFVKLLLLVVSVFIIYGFLSAMTFAAWSVGESSARQGWSIKLSGVDSLVQRKFFSANVSYSIFWGYAAGMGLFGFIAVMYYAAVKYAGLSITSISLSGVPEAYSESTYTVLTALSAALIAEITFRLFIVSWLREKFKKVWIGIVVSSLVWSVAAISLWDVPFGFLEIGWQCVLFFILGIAHCIVYLRYGILSSIIATTLVSALGLMEPILFSSGVGFFGEKIIFGIFLALPVIVAIIGLIRNEEFQFTVDTTPSHIKRISERERMTKELEIARNVQMSLLPKENPHLIGFDIAGICIPAFEVGGDYYDFVDLGKTKIGIAIGDVSGKGVPAAIYMTLTKGILQSHAEENVSPKVVLSKVNRLMYKTIEKNSFVSMFYAIIDLQTKTIRYSRAGHNPVILAGLREDKHEFLTPKGVALGLDEGGVFDAVLEEREYKLREGDLLVFYTDGFIEARNKKGEEFDESRLLHSVASAKEKSAEQIIDAVVHDTKKFIGDAQQHDDMTMVVVKVG